jgi:hypothetical protein
LFIRLIRPFFLSIVRLDLFLILFFNYELEVQLQKVQRRRNERSQQTPGAIKERGVSVCTQPLLGPVLERRRRIGQHQQRSEQLEHQQPLASDQRHVNLSLLAHKLPHEEVSARQSLHSAQGEPVEQLREPVRVQPGHTQHNLQNEQ